MTQDTQDTTFWSQVATDHYYTCSSSFACVYQAGADDEYSKNTDTGTGASDWTVPLDDDDEDAPYCTVNSNTDYACSSIQCIVQRPLDTGDTEQDFMFSPTPGSSGQDVMEIRPGRALVGINESDCGSNCAYAQTVTSSSVIEIPIVAGATSVFASAAVLLASAATLFAF